MTNMQSAWALNGGDELPFIVQVVDEAVVLTRQLRKFDRTLWASLLGVAAAMLAVQLLVLCHSLKPLDSIGAEVRAIESGQRDALSESAPKEPAPLTGSINFCWVPNAIVMRSTVIYSMTWRTAWKRRCQYYSIWQFNEILIRHCKKLWLIRHSTSKTP